MESRVYQIVALVKPFRTGAVLEGLHAVEILGGTVREAMGYGRQKNRLHRYLGSEYNASFLPKVELTLYVRETDVATAVVERQLPGRLLLEHAKQRSASRT